MHYVTYLSCFIIAIIPIDLCGATAQPCSNGIFKCVSPNSLRLCFRGRLISSEFFCPSSRFCCETSKSICTKFVTPSCYNSSNVFPSESSTDEIFKNLIPKCEKPGDFSIDTEQLQGFIRCRLDGNKFKYEVFECEDLSSNWDETNCRIIYESKYQQQEVSPKPELIPVCKSRGKFPVPNSNCSEYLLCTPTTTGFTNKTFTCPSGSLFDPEVARCTSSYICNKISTIPVTTLSEISTISVTTKEENINKPVCTTRGKISIRNTNCTQYILCTPVTNGFQNKSYICPLGNLFNPELERCTSSYICTEVISTTSISFEPSTDSSEILTTIASDCQGQGKFPVANSNCQKYILCILTGNGFRVKEYNCPLNSLFDPALKKCTATYSCDDVLSTTVETTITEAISTAFSITEQSSQQTFLPDPVTPTAKEIITNKPEFVCKNQGKFSIPNTNCQEYVLCTKTGNGFKEKNYKCPSGFYFDPNLKKCNKIYVCPELTTITVPFSEQTTSFSTETSNHTVVSTETITTQKSDTSICQSQGKFLIFNTNCQKYVLCIKTKNGYTKKNYKCPSGFYFNPDTKKCNSNYVCSEQTTESIPTTKSTTTEEMTTTTKNSNSTICQNQGKYSIPNTNCKEYVLCTATENGFKEKMYQCPPEFYFDPVKKRCSSVYVCDDLIISTTEILTSTSPSTSYETTSTFFSTTKETLIPSSSTTDKSLTTDVLTSTTSYLQCKAEGRFPVPNVKCKKYYLCSITSHGFISKEYGCPTNSLFDPTNQHCTYNRTFICPEIPQTTDVSSTTIETTTSSCTNNEVVPECVRQGRFSILGTRCTKYVLCISTTKGFISTNYICPKNTTFNPQLDGCSTRYICPEKDSCTDQSSSPPTTTTQKVGFQCTTQGRFYLEGTGCRNYLLCILTKNGLIGMNYTCPQDAFFDPVDEGCSTVYTCPETERNQSRNKRQAIPNGDCVTVGRYVIPRTLCKQYMLCTANSDGTLKRTNFVCPTTSVFNQVIQKCTAAYVCPDSVCFAPGLYSNPNVKNCSSYISCERDWNNVNSITFIGTVERCPQGTYYNPFMQFCDSTYVCPT